MDLIGGGTPKTSTPEYWGGSIPWLSVKDFNNNKRYVYTTEKTITEDGLANSSTKLLNHNDSIISARGTVGEIAMIPFPMAFNQSCYGLRAKKEIVTPVYLYYLIKHNIHVLRKNTHGSVFDTITRDTFTGIDVDIPEIKIQNSISAILSSIDDKIELNTTINENLHQQYLTVIDEKLSIINDYEKKPLSEVANCQNGRAFYKEGYDIDGALVVDLGNVNTSGNFIFTNSDKFISIERYNDCKLEKYRVYKDDLVMVMTDRKSTMELLGKVGKIYKPGYYLLNQRMYRIRAKKSINANYLYAFLNSTAVHKVLKEKALGTVQKYVNTGDINTLEIVIPPPRVMQEISEMINPIFLQMENNILENEKLNNLRDTLLPKLMNGEIDVSQVQL